MNLQQKFGLSIIINYQYGVTVKYDNNSYIYILFSMVNQHTINRYNMVGR